MSRAYGSSRSFRKSAAAIWMIGTLSCDEIEKRYVFDGDWFGVKSEHGVIDMELIKSEEKWERLKHIEYKTHQMINLMINHVQQKTKDAVRSNYLDYNQSIDNACE